MLCGRLSLRIHPVRQEVDERLSQEIELGSFEVLIKAFVEGSEFSLECRIELSIVRLKSRTSFRSSFQDFKEIDGPIIEDRIRLRIEFVKIAVAQLNGF